MIQSPKVETYDQAPRMSCDEITDQITQIPLTSKTVIICNFANADMVGHTGNMDATIQSIEAVDQCIARLKKWSEEQDIDLMITADHGNADQMHNEKTNTPKTSHSEAPVPFIIHTKRNYSLAKSGKLSDVAPTILNWLHTEIPTEMTGTPLHNRSRVEGVPRNENDE